MKAQKVSLTLDSAILAEARVHARGNLSAFVNEALGAHVRGLRMDRLLRDLDDEFGPVPGRVRERARRDLADAVRSLEHT